MYVYTNIQYDFQILLLALGNDCRAILSRTNDLVTYLITIELDTTLRINEYIPIRCKNDKITSMNDIYSQI